MGYCILVVAGTKEGKTTLIKNLIFNKPCCVFDVNAEYNDLPTDVELPRSRFYSDNITDFIDIATSKHNGTICVFEEATGFFSGRANEKTKKVVIGKRHPVDKGGRNLIFVFHDINSIPPFLLSNADTIILGKTGDDPQMFGSKSKKLIPVYNYIKDAPKYTFINFKNK